MIETEKAHQLRGTPAKMQINAPTIGPSQERVFRIEISKHENDDIDQRAFDVLSSPP